MNRETKEVVYNILNNDERARESDLHLIFTTLQKMLHISGSTPFMGVLWEMEAQGISFESITRRRRKWLEEHPDIRDNLKITPIRKDEEEQYILENMNHIPRID